MLRLKEEAHNFVVDHFDEVSKCDEFLLLDADRLSLLLKDDELYVPAEEHVLNALMRWVENDVVVRKPSVETLLECVRFKHLRETVS